MAQRPETLKGLDGFRRELELCQACPKLCVQACPIGEATGSERLSSWGKMSLAAQLAQGYRSLTRQEAEIFYYCLGCMQCAAVCKEQVLIDDVLIQGRFAAYRQGVYPPQLDAWLETFRLYNNPFGINLQERQRTLVDEMFWSERPQAVYLPGSHELARAPEHTTKLFNIFQSLGIDWVGLFVGADTSVGSSLYRMGMEDLFRKHAYRFYRQLLGFKRIISSDPEVLYALRVIYPRYGFQLNATLQHSSEFLAPYVQNHHHPATDDRRHCLHHSPLLSRGLGVQKGAERIQSLIFKRPGAPLYWNGRYTWSSGFEEPVGSLYPEVSAAIARRRIAEIMAHKVDVALTASPGDYFQLKRHAPPELAVEDLIDLLHAYFTTDT